MALLVFLTFLSLIVNQYVPVWMKDSEASHMDAAVGQFADLKGAIDYQVLGALMAQNAGAPFIPSTTSTSVTLGVDGVPIFSSATPGSLSSNPDNGVWNISFQYRINNVLTYFWQNATGQVDLTVQNRYYPAGDIVYENGAVIRSQPDGQVIRAAPTFQASIGATNINIGFELINLYGSGSTAGTTTQIIDTKVFGVNQQSYANLTAPLQIIHTSAYGRAWFSYFNSTLSSGLKPPAATYSVVGPITTVTSTYYTITLLNLGTGLYRVSLVINVAPLSVSFTLQQAFVNVGIGQGSKSV